MKKIIDYQVLYTNSVVDIDDVIKGAMSLGWQPLSGTSVDDGVLYQAMVKYEEEKTEDHKNFQHTIAHNKQ